MTGYADFLGNDGVSFRELVFDRLYDRYLLVEAGRENGSRVYGTPTHIDIEGGKLWIQHDSTEDSIVLAFRPASLRALTEYAAA